MLRHGAAGDAAEYREESVMRRLLFLAVIVVLLGGAVALGSTAVAQSDPTPDAAGGTADTDGDGSEDYCLQDRAACEPQRIMGESAFGEGATGELLAVGAIPAAPSQPAALALQRVRLAKDLSGRADLTTAEADAVIRSELERRGEVISSPVETKIEPSEQAEPKRTRRATASTP